MKINSMNQMKPIVNSDIRANQSRSTVNVDLSGVVSSPSDNIEVKKMDRVDKIANEDKENEIVDNSIQQANKSLKQVHRVIERNVHETTKAIMYVIKDTDTDEIIAEFPPKKIQDMIAKMWELAGLFVDEKA